MGRKFESAGERIGIFEDDFQGVCEVLAGPSRWKDYIAPNIAPALKKFPGRTFNIISVEEFKRHNPKPDELGFTNKTKGVLVLKTINDRMEAMMTSALHEMVHWISHPPEQGKAITAFGFLEEGLLEGLTQVVTEDILQDQGIKPYSKPAYPERVAIVRKLIERWGIPPFGEVLFRGQFQGVKQILDFYGQPALQQIRTLATMNNQKKAIECIENLNRAGGAKRPKAAGVR